MMGNDEMMARALGWFSIGLGLAELLAPGGVSKAIGLRDDDENHTVLRTLGAREIMSGIGILSQPRPTGWLWSRVAGDVMDLTLLSRALASDDSERDKVTAATAAVLGVTVLDLLCSIKLSRASGAEGKKGHESQATEVKLAVTINRSPEELYQFWHNFENLPRFMYHLETVQNTGERHSHWKAKAPAGKTVEWDAEVVKDQPNERISWRSLEGADIDNTGTVRFQPAPGGRGTMVLVEMRYNPPGGAAGKAIAKLFGEEPEKQVWEDLHRFKQIMELGEIVRSEGSLEGMGSSQRPAQQPAEVTSR